VNLLVTGASGFLGTHTVPRLLERGHRVWALVRRPAAAEQVAALGATPVAGDLDDAASLDAAFVGAGCDALVNLASLGFGHAPAIVAAAQDAGIRRALFVSTTAIFTSLSPGSKAVRLAAEDAIRASDLEWTIVRPTMIYGTPSDRNLARLLRVLMRISVVPMPGAGSRLQQPVHVDDLAQAIATAIESDVAIGRTYDLAGPDAITLRQLLYEAGEAVGRRPVLVKVPMNVSITLVRLYERMARQPRFRAEQLERLGEDKAYDIEPARLELGYRPRPFRDGIRAEAALLA
jgi:uncharacterized protein YbjT (DUF2867 family)